MIKQPETTVFGGEVEAFRIKCLCINIEVSLFGGLHSGSPKRMFDFQEYDEPPIHTVLQSSYGAGVHR